MGGRGRGRGRGGGRWRERENRSGSLRERYVGKRGRGYLYSERVNIWETPIEDTDLSASHRCSCYLARNEAISCKMRIVECLLVMTDRRTDKRPAVIPD